MADPVSMFEKLVQQRQKGKPVSEPAAPAMDPAPQKCRRQTIGKRSDPTYTQVGAYIPKELNQDVKRLLMEMDQNFSDLVTQLLDAWVKQQTD